LLQATITLSTNRFYPRVCQKHLIENDNRRVNSHIQFQGKRHTSLTLTPLNFMTPLTAVTMVLQQMSETNHQFVPPTLDEDLSDEVLQSVFQHFCGSNESK
jgi:hypothetical protein